MFWNCLVKVWSWIQSRGCGVTLQVIQARKYPTVTKLKWHCKVKWNKRPSQPCKRMYCQISQILDCMVNTKSQFGFSHGQMKYSCLNPISIYSSFLFLKTWRNVKKGQRCIDRNITKPFKSTHLAIIYTGLSLQGCGELVPIFSGHLVGYNLDRLPVHQKTRWTNNHVHPHSHLN